ncbi:hypothetical protein [Bacillus sp. OTU530]|uniref:hypothetical protein n=1 Tax=Bacillus sp. OTU530 TaxID=3043862 RepID=UPI00313D12C8
MKKFQFEKVYEEVEIGDKVYRVDFSDDKALEYRAKFNKFYKEAQELEKTDLDTLSDEEQLAIFHKNRENMKEITDVILGEGAFDELYELSGRSTANYMQLLLFLGKVVAEKTEKVKEDARKKYVKKGRA